MRVNDRVSTVLGVSYLVSALLVLMREEGMRKDLDLGCDLLYSTYIKEGCSCFE